MRSPNGSAHSGLLLCKRKQLSLLDIHRALQQRKICPPGHQEVVADYCRLFLHSSNEVQKTNAERDHFLMFGQYCIGLIGNFRHTKFESLEQLITAMLT